MAGKFTREDERWTVWDLRGDGDYADLLSAIDAAAGPCELVVLNRNLGRVLLVERETTPERGGAGR